MDVTFEFFAAMERQLGQSRLTLSLPEDTPDIAAALTALQQARPELAAAVERCACVSGDSIASRKQPIPADRLIGLLPPVAGG